MVLMGHARMHWTKYAVRKTHPCSRVGQWEPKIVNS